MVYQPNIMILNIYTNYALFWLKVGPNVAKTQKIWFVFFFFLLFFPEGKQKTEKCASEEVGRRSYVITKKKKNYTPLILPCPSQKKYTLIR